MKNVIKNKVGLGWISLFIISGIYFWGLLNLGFWGILIFPVYIFWGILSVIIAHYCKPDAIITSGGYLSHLKAEFFYGFSLPLFIMFGVPAVLLIIFISWYEQPSEKSLKDDIKNACSIEQIKKTGTKKCETAKQNFSIFINKELLEIKKEYDIEKNIKNNLSKDKTVKCSEKGLIEYGSEGCNTITTKLEDKIQHLKELDMKIHNLEKELNSLKK